MTHRQSPDDETAPGLIAWSESTRIRLPLKAIDTSFRVFGDIAEVRIDQVFHQNNAAALDVTYTFPLPADAAVHGLDMIVDDRVIRAVIREENEARELAARFKAEGRRVARTETPRENLFNLELGNVQPGDVIVIRLAYFQILDRVGDLLSLSIPCCPGIRYIPGRPLLRSNRGDGVVDDTTQVPDASRITPPRIGDLHPDAASFSAEGSISAEGADDRSLSSPSHAIIVSERDGRLAVALATSETVPDRDFVLRWRERADDTALRVLCHRAGDHTYAAVRIAAPRALPEAGREPVDVYLLMDRSGSMGGIKWSKAVEALRRFAGELSPRDRIYLTLFDTAFIDFDERPIPPGEMLDDAAFAHIETEEGPRGGTELLPALEHVIDRMNRHSAAARAMLVLITDGEVGNEEEILRAMTRHGAATVHCFGIDTTVNDAFLKRLAREHGGGCVLLNPHDNIPQAVAALAVRLRQPALLGLVPTGDWEPARRADGRGVNVHAGEALTAVFRGPAHARELRLAGQRAGGAPAEFSFPVEPDGSEAPRLLWAKGRISELLADGRRAEAVAMAVEHNIACDGTSFLAWDDAQHVPVARREVYQPSLHPGEWDLDSTQFVAQRSATLDSPIGEPDDIDHDWVHRRAAPVSIDEPSDWTSPTLCHDSRKPSADARPASPLDAYLSRYRRFAYAGLPFPASIPNTIRVKRRFTWLRDALSNALDALPRDTGQIIVGLLMTWMVRGGKRELHARAARLESIVYSPSDRDPRGMLRTLAECVSGEEGEAIRALLQLLDQSAPG